MSADNESFQFDGFFDNAISTLRGRQELLRGVVETDYKQAEKFQKDYKAFEKNYFKEYMRISQESHQNGY